MPPLRDAEATLLASVERAIADLGGKLSESDSPAVQLAREYAAVIDASYGHCRGCEDPECRRAGTSAWSARWIGPEFLKAIDALGMTPAARHALAKGGKPGDGKPSGLQGLRDSRSA